MLAIRRAMGKSFSDSEIYQAMRDFSSKQPNHNYNSFLNYP